MRFPANQHFSHRHTLVPLSLEDGDNINCNGCGRLIQEPFQGCVSCSYYLQEDCLNAPRFLKHPSHPHSLTLLPTPTYPSGCFYCNACGLEGNAFSLCCAKCEFDLHVHCANSPSVMLLQNDPHVLKMIFGSPYEDKSTRYVCDLCGEGMCSDHWIYYCADCDFAAHLACASSAQKKTQETSGENQGTLKRKPQNSTVHNHRSSREELDVQNSDYIAQKKMKETTFAHEDNASST